MQLKAVCKTLRSNIIVIQSTAQYKQRLLVVDSELNELFEFDPVTGDTVNCQPLRGPHSRTKQATKWWPTSIALCPYNGDFYVCQYLVSLVCSHHGCVCWAWCKK